MLRSNIILPASITVGAALLTVFDRILKWVALTQWTDRHVELLPGVQLTFLLNKGIALSVPLTGTVALVCILLLFLALLAWLVLTVWRHDWVRSSILGAVLLGAGSNIVDRFLYGGVVDYLQVVLPSVINLADVMVVAGIVGLLVLSGRRSPVSENQPTSRALGE